MEPATERLAATPRASETTAPPPPLPPPPTPPLSTTSTEHARAFTPLYSPSAAEAPVAVALGNAMLFRT